MKYSKNMSLTRYLDGMIIFYVLGAVFLACQPEAFASEKQSGIEIFANGRKYDSIDEYRIDRMSKAVVRLESSGPQRDWVNIQNIVRSIQNLMASPFDIAPRSHVLKDTDVKQITLKAFKVTEKQPANGYDPFLESYGLISRIGFNTGINKVVEEFQQDILGNFRSKRLMAKDLESTLRQSFGSMDYDGPILIISHQKKLRIMTLQSENAGGDQHLPKVLDLNP